MVRVLVLGATGSIGSRAAIALAIAGHDVTALIRTESATTKTLQQFGVRLATGNITEVSTWENLFYSSKVIVLATNLKGSEVDSIITLATNNPGLVRERKVIVYTSGVLVYGLTTNNKPVDEFAPTNPIPGVEWRVDVENKILASTLFERTIILRPGFVYGHNHGYLEAFGAVAGGKVPVVIGNGENRIPIVHVDDLADGYVRVIENGSARGIYNLTSDRAVRYVDIVKTTAAAAGNDTISHRNIDYENHPFDYYFTVDQLISSERAKYELGWRHKHVAVTDAADVYFQAWKSYQ